jgi:hypothetical protein
MAIDPVGKRHYQLISTGAILAELDRLCPTCVRAGLLVIDADLRRCRFLSDIAMA